MRTDEQGNIGLRHPALAAQDAGTHYLATPTYCCLLPDTPNQLAAQQQAVGFSTNRSCNRSHTT
jgi:hypothetical protein